MNQSQQLVPVEFHGDTLEAVKDGDRVWVSLRRCCENLGVDLKTQWRKVQGKPWACMVEMTMQVPGDSQSRCHTMIALRSLPMWLATISPGKVKPEVRVKLVRYQMEAADVLADHFLGKRGPAAGGDLLGQLVALVVQGQQQMLSAITDLTRAVLDSRSAADGAGLSAGERWRMKSNDRKRSDALAALARFRPHGHGLSLRGLAEQLGCDSSYLSALERDTLGVGPDPAKAKAARIGNANRGFPSLLDGLN